MAKRRTSKHNQKFETDYGTPELIRKRAELVGSEDPALAEHPFGVLYARGLLSPDHTQARKMYAAGMDFGILWGRVFKPAFAQSMMAAHVAGSSSVSYDEKEQAKAHMRWKSTAAFLKERQVYDALVNWVVYRRPNMRTLEKLRTALCRLIQFERSQKQAA